jgi:hypothetical protein
MCRRSCGNVARSCKVLGLLLMRVATDPGYLVVLDPGEHSCHTRHDGRGARNRGAGPGLFGSCRRSRADSLPYRLPSVTPNKVKTFAAFGPLRCTSDSRKVQSRAFGMG